MKIGSSRFDEVEIDDKDVMNFERGIIGFPSLKRFVLMDFSDSSPFHWLQSIDEPEVGFVVSDPGVFIENYVVNIDDDTKQLLRVDKDSEMVVMIVVTVKDGGRDVSGNLMGPIIVNADKRLGCQVVINTPDYNTRTPMKNDAGIGRSSKANIGVAV